MNLMAILSKFHPSLASHKLDSCGEGAFFLVMVDFQDDQQHVKIETCHKFLGVSF